MEPLNRLSLLRGFRIRLTCHHHRQGRKVASYLESEHSSHAYALQTLPKQNPRRIVHDVDFVDVHLTVLMSRGDGFRGLELLGIVWQNTKDPGRWQQQQKRATSFYSLIEYGRVTDGLGRRQQQQKRATSFYSLNRVFHNHRRSRKEATAAEESHFLLFPK
ncbi:hypothetical protein J6590_092993 [Homalodisca vitripennis]|nr:hypothetical protein J6590_092993 [Homalodisca vitripennis]